MREITPQELNDRELIITLMQRHLIKAVTIFPATKTVFFNSNLKDKWEIQDIIKK